MIPRQSCLQRVFQGTVRGWRGWVTPNSMPPMVPCRLCSESQSCTVGRLRSHNTCRSITLAVRIKNLPETNITVSLRGQPYLPGPVRIIFAVDAPQGLGSRPEPVFVVAGVRVDNIGTVLGICECAIASGYCLTKSHGEP